MESHGMPGRIQITRETYELLADEFECEARGRIPVKGKGEIEAWYLVGRRADRASAPSADGRFARAGQGGEERGGRNDA
jgi:class 3 adenylate cyclase